MTRTLLGALAAAALLATPACALADGSPTDPGKSTQPTSHERATTQAEPPGPAATPASKPRAYGRYCKDQSKKHVAGQKGTPFSQCVTAMAKLASGKTASPARACKDLSTKRAADEKRAPYSKCIVAAARLERDE